MSQAVVVHEIAVLLVVVAIGFVLRRLGLLDDDTTRRASRIVVDVAMPALVFSQLVETTDAGALIGSWYVPLLGAGLLIVMWGVARAVATVAGGTPTFTFVAGLPNWIYLPLPIVAAAYGDAGVRDLLLINAGAMPLLWTLGVGILRGGAAWGEAATNPGLLATIAAVIAVAWSPALPGPPAIWEVLGSSIGMVGALTIPLSLLLTGAQLGASRLSAPSPQLLVAIVVRLIVGPLVAVGILVGARAVGLDPGARLGEMLVLVAAMPVAISASMFAERFGGDVPLASQAILWTTPLSLATVPVVLAIQARG
jgi:predicted permease